MSNYDRDDELARQLAATLERSLDHLDADALAQLAHGRRQALNPHRRARQWAVGLALAAGIAAVAVLPWRSAPQGGEHDMSYLSVEPQMLADLEMLEALGTDEMLSDAPGGSL